MEDEKELKEHWIKQKRWELYLKYGPHYRLKMTKEEKKEIEEALTPPATPPPRGRDDLLYRAKELFDFQEETTITILLTSFIIFSPVVFPITLLYLLKSAETEDLDYGIIKGMALAPILMSFFWYTAFLYFWR